MECNETGGGDTERVQQYCSQKPANHMHPNTCVPGTILAGPSDKQMPTACFRAQRVVDKLELPDVPQARRLEYVLAEVVLGHIVDKAETTLAATPATTPSSAFRGACFTPEVRGLNMHHQNRPAPWPPLRQLPTQDRPCHLL